MEQLDIVKPYYILSLDGGGSLGVYTLGVLSEIEQMMNTPLHTTFDLVYGTSTGAIIASMIALGESVTHTVNQRYMELAPDVMNNWLAGSRTATLRRHAKDIFGNKHFEDFLINVGIVCTDLQNAKPVVFKKHKTQAKWGHNSFESGFGCSIADAVVASCAARPYFKKVCLSSPNSGHLELIDGGFIANFPTLFALADALRHLKIPRDHVRVLSIGTGSFPQRFRITSLLDSFAPTLATIVKGSSNTVDIVRQLFFDDIKMIRINDVCNDKRYRTDFLEARSTRLTEIFQRGRESFREYEAKLFSFFNEPLI
ncbi:MAG: patatin-like phospholipase family protein [Gammaproteobacteria bacterium]|nr:patatin-like phospholipase family protein [Gammaproteobacteria bacterium]